MKEFFTGYNELYKRLTVVPDYQAAVANPERYKIQEDWLPRSKDARILDIGCGWGNSLLALWATGYRNLTGIDVSESMCKKAKEGLTDKSIVICVEALRFLKEKKRQYDLITMFQVIEHMEVGEAYELLKECHRRLSQQGSIVIVTPNMTNIFAASSRYADITHSHGYTEWSLFQLLDKAGFKKHRIIKASKKWKQLRTFNHPFRGLGLREVLNTFFHEGLLKLQGHHLHPSTFSINLTVQSWKNSPNENTSFH